MGGSLSADNPRQAAVDKAVRQATLEGESAAAIERLLATLNAEPVRAVSKAQVYWARAELRRVQAGGHSRCSLEELKGMAETPLEGLPERASKKPRKAKPYQKAKGQ
jgi:hypothetical protein